jgi:hypothetical protein
MVDNEWSDTSGLLEDQSVWLVMIGAVDASVAAIA